jgi:hypothetical protein
MSVNKDLSDTPGEMDTEDNFETYEGFMTAAKVLSGMLVVLLIGMAFFLI